MAKTNKQWLLKERPVGMVGPEHFELVESPLPEVDLKAGQVLVKTLMLGFDPAMRGWLAGRAQLPAARRHRGTNARQRRRPGGAASETRALPEGTLVQGLLNWQEYSVAEIPQRLIPPRPHSPAGHTPQPGTWRFRHHQPHRVLRTAGRGPATRPARPYWSRAQRVPPALSWRR